MSEYDECRFVVYTDYNCPFCYALNERIIALNLGNRVTFRDVQHAPLFSSSQTGFEILSNLTTEVAEVCRRAPSTQINVPMFRPNTGLASALINAVSQVSPAEARILRQQIFRALWIDGEDISNPEVLASLLQESNIKAPKENLTDLDELARWQLEWDSNQAFEGKIPIVISDSGETVVGFPLEPEIDGFLTTGSLISDQLLPGASQHQQRQRILVLENDVPSLQMIIQQMQEVQVEVVKDFNALIELVRDQGAPDLVIANMALISGIENASWWRDTTNSDLETTVPVILISDVKTTELEIAAFESGAAEFIAKPFHPKILKARLNMHLQTHRYQQQLNNIARVDALTSICNRREFDTRLLTEWRRNARAGTQLALLMIDIDKFKEYNDINGHLRGDNCLVKVAHILTHCVQRPGDTLARYGGEEFVALLPGSDMEGAMQVAQQCLEAIQAAAIPHANSSVSAHVTISVGVAAMIPVREKSMTLLVEEADIALYQAKKKGRNQICSFDNDFD